MENNEIVRDGTMPAKAFDLTQFEGSDKQKNMYRKLQEMFGSDNDYFIHQESLMPNYRTKKNYKAVLVETLKDEKKQQIWFEV